MHNVVLVIALTVSLVANAVLFVGGVIYDVVDHAVTGTLGIATAAATQRQALATRSARSAKHARTLATSKAAIARQRGELSSLRAAVARQNRQLSAANALSANQRNKLAAVRAVWSQQGRDLNALKTALARQGRARGWENRNIRNSVGGAAKRSRARLLRAATRSALSAPAEAVPYLGMLAVVGFTAWEIRDYCATIRDMDEIQGAIDGGDPQNEPTDCEGQVRRSLQEQWDEWRKHMPDLPEWGKLLRWTQRDWKADALRLKDAGDGILKRVWPSSDR